MVSFLLGALFVAGGVLVGSVIPGSAPIAGGVVVVGVLNLILGVLSVLPAMPLDGGRVVRAFAWSRYGDRDRAYRTTARVGRMIGWTILGAGVALVLADLVTEGLIGIALGWLLNTGARTGERRLALEQLLRGAQVSDAMRVDVPFVGPNLTIDTFASRFEGQDAVAAMPVVDDDKVVGVVGRKRLVRLGRRRFGGTRVDQVMAAAPPQAPVLAPSDALWDAVEAMNEGGLDGLAVADGARLAGLVTRDSLADAIRSRSRRAGRAVGMSNAYGFGRSGGIDLSGELLLAEAAQATVLAGVEPLADVERIAPEAALGRVLAAPLVAGVSLPPWDNSAMDGYAVRAADVAAAAEGGPVRLAVGASRGPGRRRGPRVVPGTAIRIATGAPIRPAPTPSSRSS